jgi:hypothetical protein
VQLKWSGVEGCVHYQAWRLAHAKGEMSQRQSEGRRSSDAVRKRGRFAVKLRRCVRSAGEDGCAQVAGLLAVWDVPQCQLTRKPVPII